MQQHSYTTTGGINIDKQITQLDYHRAIEPLIDQLDHYRGALFASSFEYPGRYTRWDIGFVKPPLLITCRKQTFTIEALNQRGEVLIPILFEHLSTQQGIHCHKPSTTNIEGQIELTTQRFPEELRSKQPSIFSVIRCITNLFYSDKDDYLGLYGAFGYDLVFQFEQLKQQQQRADNQRDLVLYLPDELFIIDHRRKQATSHQYEFSIDNKTTKKLPRTGKAYHFKTRQTVKTNSDHTPGEYADIVKIAKQKFKRGDLFEVVPGQMFFEPCKTPPSDLFRRIREMNPSPYGLFINLGDDEYLVGASPEMYVRVNDKQVETCPISGTIKRGKDAIEDAQQIQQLLNSKKDESELTMCTDVDRNDKSRICEPGSVRVIGRRQIEMYSRVIHTVDHVVGTLRQGYDALDAFLSHAWVVTVTGAPKIWAMQFIEDHEKSPRRWYAGAVGILNFNGNMNTGLTIRTIRIDHGIAEVRVGATLLYDSDPEAEEQETQLKAAAFIDALRHEKSQPKATKPEIKSTATTKKILLVDHQDSFVHTLANYLRQTGADVATLRSGFSEAEFNAINPDLVVLSPGPGSPSNFNTNKTIDMAVKHNRPIFGVCLGLQALIEYFGGQLDVLDYPIHGKPATIKTNDGKLFKGLPNTFTTARYHSLYVKQENVPDVFHITATSNDNVVMAIEHKTKPISAVQFHPESILSLQQDCGLKIIKNVIQ